MASDYLLEIDGIKGESTDDKHKGSIHIESFSWGVTNPSPGGGGGGGGGAGKATFQDFHFTKSEDSTSPELFLRCASGQRIKKATLYVREAAARGGEFLQVELENLLVSSFSQAGSGDTPSESISLNFTKITFSHTPLSTDGTAPGVVRTGWDLATNKKA
jgi:type VI secretion system secreted protein Hcp